MSDTCDYCYAELPKRFTLRAVGFVPNGESESPLVRAWCGACEPDDEIDPISEAAVQRAFAAQREAQR